MLEWYLELSLLERLILLLLTAAFISVMTASFRSLFHSRVGWYRGIQSAPVFQILMWIGALPFIIPFFAGMYYRKRRIRSARFIGNLRSGIYHHPSCEYQEKISSLFFKYPLDSHEDAMKYRFRPCRVCLQRP